ncbi:uncharacterized protein LOC129223124 [Uloborus diversus]|uniref:uncharacterized protein LOC129223124 n=1 Tax=Uloborus diversus TaxID=327109 RepID=UPI002409D10F|nr:uncharacterized protein LOC129223124 [Uloborus diversus]
MKVLLMDRNCWEFIDGKPELPKDCTAQETRDFNFRKIRSYTSIYQSIERLFQSLIAQTNDGKEAWNILKTNFEPTSRARIAGLIDEFYEIRFKPDEETIGIYCKRLVEKRAEVKDAGFEIPELLTCFQMIRRLPAEYENLFQYLYRLDDGEFTADKLESQLIAESGRIQQKQKDNGFHHVENAFSSEQKQLQKFNGEPRTGETDCKNNGAVQCKAKNQNNSKTEGRNASDYQTNQHRRNYGKNKFNNYRRKFPDDEKNTKGMFYSEAESNSKEDNLKIQSTSTRKEQLKLDEFLLDSASTSHFCFEKSWFENYRSLKSPTKALIGDKNCESEVLGIGNIIFYIQDRNHFVKVKLLNVYYAPNMRRNLIGGANLDLAGYRINWGNDKMIVCNENNEYFFTVNRVNKLYIVYGLPECRITEIDSIENYHVKVDVNLIHRRFGHVNVPLLKTMSNLNCVKGIGEIKAKVEREQNVKLKCVRTDNSLEFCPNQFKAFLANLGIKAERSSTFTPEQMGVAERYNRSVMDGVRSMLHDSGLQEKFWAEALHTFVYISNRCKHKNSKDKTPIELWTGYKPSVRHFKIIGLLAFVHIPKVKRNKLQARAQKSSRNNSRENRRMYRNGVRASFGKEKMCEYVIFRDEEDFTEPISSTAKAKVELRSHSDDGGEKSQTLESINWKRIERPSKMSKQIDVYYFSPSGERLRSIYDAETFCERENVKFDEDFFNFKPLKLVNINECSETSEVKFSEESSDGDEFLDTDFQDEIHAVEIPKSFEDVQVSPEKTEWESAMSDEIQILNEWEVYEIVDRPPKAKIIGNRWV